MNKTTQDKLNIYLDSCAFISFFSAQENDVEAKRAEMVLKILEEAKKGAIDIYTSQVSISECLLSNKPSHRNKKGCYYIESFFDQKFINKVQVDRSVAFLSREIQRQVKTISVSDKDLKPVDSIHISTSRLVQANYLFTYDNGVIKYNGHILAGHIIICDPCICWTEQTSMEDVADFSSNSLSARNKSVGLEMPQ